LGHQIAQETANIAQQAGFGTDAARSLGEKMVGTTTWTPEAIKSTARMNRALSTGVTLFNQGVNNAVEKAGNSPFAAREFQNKLVLITFSQPNLCCWSAIYTQDNWVCVSNVTSRSGVSCQRRCSACGVCVNQSTSKRNA